MKIVHLTTSLQGGAGIAAKRLAEAQIENGMDSCLLTRNSGIDEAEQSVEWLPSRLPEKLKSKFLTFTQFNFLQNSSLLVTPLGISLDLESNLNFQKAEILHFHAFYNLIEIKKIIELAKERPVVVTLHDQRFFTGGCHYSFSSVRT